MKKNFLLSLLFGFSLVLKAQFEPLTYDRENNPGAFKISPQIALSKSFYIGFPALSNFQIELQNSGFTAYDLLGTDNGNFNDKWQSVLENLRPGNGFFFHAGTEWLQGALKNFDGTVYRFGFRTDFQAWFFHPVSFYRFVAYGNQNPENVIDISELNFNAEAYHTLYFGFSKQTGDFFKYGINFNLYNGAGNFSSYGNHGKIYYTQGQNNYYTHRFDDLNMLMHSSGISNLIEKDKIGTKDVNENQVRRDLIGKFLGTGNWGLGLDAGFDKSLNDRWRWTGAISDLGFIYYRSDAFSVRAHGSYAYEGVHVIFPDTPKDYWREIREDFRKSVPFDTTRNGYIKWRPFKIYTALKFNYGNRLTDRDMARCPGEIRQPKSDSSFGFLGFYQNLQGKPYIGGGIVWTTYPFRQLNLRLAFTSDNYLKTNLSVSIQWHILGWYWYINAGNLLGYTDLAYSNGQTLQFGTFFAF